MNTDLKKDLKSLKSVASFADPLLVADIKEALKALWRANTR